MKPISVNTSISAFCRWLHEEGHHAVRLELPLLKLEKRVLQTLTDEQMTTLPRASRRALLVAGCTPSSPLCSTRVSASRRR